MNITRSDFIARGLMGACVASSAPLSLFSASAGTDKKQALHAFSKNFMFLSRDEFCDVCAETGLDGVEWCVRGASHVNPLAVKKELPLAVKAASARGLATTMICTRSKGDGTDKPEEGDILETLKVSADNGIKLWRPGSFVYDAKLPIRDNLEIFRRKFARLEELSRLSGVKCAFQNHFGCFGGGIYDMLDIVRDLDPKCFSLQYDVLHAVFETPVSWERHLREAAPFISSACLKDCNELARQKENMWKTFRTVPAPTGVVPFERYVKLIREIGIDVPHSVHFEIPLPKNDRAELLSVMRREAGYFRQVFNG